MHKDNEKRMGQMLDAITRPNIVANHEKRLGNLEGKPMNDAQLQDMAARIQALGSGAIFLSTL